jgi:hypothetical protein
MVTATKFGEVRQGEKTLALEPLLRSAARTQRELDCQETGRVHAEMFLDIQPACAMVQVAALVGAAVVEIEAEAVVTER